MENIKISVIMSVYNSENYLNSSIESILNQSFSNFEFIIINDCSNDNSLKIINEYKNIDKRIKLVENDINLGLPVSLNKAIKIAYGKYIARMDADDIAIANRLETQFNFLEKNKNIGAVGSYVKTFGIEKKKWKYPISSEWIKTSMIFDSSLAHPSVMIRKEILLDNPYNEELKVSQDFDLWIRLSQKGVRFYNIPKVLLYYQINQKSNSRKTQNIDYRGELYKLLFGNNLLKLNIEIDEEEKNVFLQISKNKFILSDKEIKIVVKIFYQILKSNKKIKIYNNFYLKSVIGIKWYNILKNNLKIKYFFSKFTIYITGGLFLKFRGLIRK